MNKSVCLITGVGEGTGGHTAKKFAEAGYTVAMLARTPERLKKFEKEIPNTKGYVCDVSNTNQLINSCEKIKSDLGPPEILIHNAVKGNFETLLEGKPEWLEENFKINTNSLMYLAHALIPDMLKSKKGVIIVTGNTAAKRGVASTPYFAPTKAAQRILAQSLAKDFGPKGIHVAYLIIDAFINTPWTRSRIKQQINQPDIIFCQPKDIAEEIYHIAHQKRSAWSFDVEIRPDIEKW
ncbi:MAG: short-chain dehydrogenase [Rickettsiales bacterium TMED251]|nr:MAG: short-chain dehydrogenase [Rickettsiales bacterium TMED251]|tara:strand:+ start:417 stop:1127 length:711 start_codon:yes stop_codon:yes gene_type:complete